MIDRFIGKDDTMKKITLSGGFLVFLGAAFWSLNSPLVKYLSLDPVLICALRSVIAGIALAFAFKDNRAFCKYLCPITVLLKPMSYFSLLRVHCDENKCVHCGKCLRVCPMNVEVNKESRKRKNGTECVLCYECTKVCPTKALH